MLVLVPCLVLCFVRRTSQDACLALQAMRVRKTQKIKNGVRTLNVERVRTQYPYMRHGVPLRASPQWEEDEWTRERTGPQWCHDQRETPQTLENRCKGP